MPTFDEAYANFCNCMDYLFSNPDSKTCWEDDRFVMSAKPDPYADGYPIVTLTFKDDVIQTYSKNLSGYEFTPNDYYRIFHHA